MTTRRSELQATGPYEANQPKEQPIQKFNPRFATSDDENEPVVMDELSDEQLDEISAGGATAISRDDTAKETTTFEYGALIVTYVAQGPDSL